MRKFAGRVAAAILVLSCLQVGAPVAHAEVQIEQAQYRSPTGFTLLSDVTSRSGITVVQTYIPQYMTVQPGHWNYEYGRTDLEQSVSYIWLGAGGCIRVYNDINGAWVYAGSIYSLTGSYWATSSGIFKAVRNNLVFARLWTGTSCPLTQ